MTRATTPHAKPGGEHTDALESGMPTDAKSAGAGPDDSHDYPVAPAADNALERGNYPAPGEQTSGGGAHNHRSLPAPSAGAGRGVMGAKGVAGGGRGQRDVYACGTMGDGRGSAKGKGYMGG